MKKSHKVLERNTVRYHDVIETLILVGVVSGEKSHRGIDRRFDTTKDIDEVQYVLSLVNGFVAGGGGRHGGPGGGVFFRSYNLLARREKEGISPSLIFNPQMSEDFNGVTRFPSLLTPLPLTICKKMGEVTRRRTETRVDLTTLGN